MLLVLRSLKASAEGRASTRDSRVVSSAVLGLLVRFRLRDAFLREVGVDFVILSRSALCFSSRFAFLVGWMTGRETAGWEDFVEEPADAAFARMDFRFAIGACNMSAI